MDAKLQRRIQRYGWDAAAPHYHDAWQAHLWPAQRTLLAMAELSPGHSVIEVAAGSGMTTFPAAAAVGPQGQVLATDLAELMVAQLRARVEERQLDRVHCARMGAENLEAADGSFDRATCALGLMYVPDPAQALKEMFRVLRPGGRMAVTVWGERRNCGWAPIFPIVDAEVASEVCPLFFATGGRQVLANMTEETGFKQVAEHRQSESLDFASGDELIRAVIDGGPVALAVKRFSPEVRERVNSAFLGSVAQFARPDGGYQIPGEFVTVAAVKP